MKRLLALAAGLLLSAPASAQSPARPSVDEKALSAVVTPDQIQVTVPIINGGASLTARLRLDLLDTDDGAVATAQRDVQILAGRQAVQMSLANPASTAPDKGAALLWYRLRYRLGPEDGSEPVPGGILALAAAAPDLFALRVDHRDLVGGWMYEARVRAFNPVTKRPVAGVTVSANLIVETAGGKQTLPLSPSAPTTNGWGEVVFRTRIPTAANRHDAELRVEAHKGAVVGPPESDRLYVRAEHRVTVSTDKLLYQPGQALHARALIVDAATGRAQAATPVAFRLLDPERDELLKAKTRTNEFGVAAVDWDLPANTRLGNYSLLVESLESHGSAWEDTTMGRSRSLLRIRRYELPTFTVSAATDRRYYLPRRNARVDISANYLFAKPVTRGTVRLSRQVAASFDDGQQKLVIDEDEEDTQTRKLDRRGHARFTVDLSADHEKFESDSRSWNLFTDVPYVAFVTDATTGRTEQRRLQIRVTRKPIQLYVSGLVEVGDFRSFYVTASYADGRPASQLDVRIGQSVGEKVYRPLGTVRTNRYGAAKVSHVRFTPESDPSHDPTIVLDARDSRGASGHWEETPWSRLHGVEISTDKTLYRPGEPIKVAIRSVLTGSLVVEVGHGDIAWSSRVALRNGSASLVIPYLPAFKGKLHLAAYSLDAKPIGRNSDHPAGSRFVLYPYDPALRVNVRTDRASYRPGDDVTASVRVAAPSGAADLQSALGVVVADRAVEERARANEEFGAMADNWPGDDVVMLEDETSVGGLTRRDLDRLDPSARWPDDLDLTAEVMLNVEPWADLRIDSESHLPSLDVQFARRIERDLRGLRNAVERAGTVPATRADLSKLLETAGLRAEALTDPWGTPYTYRWRIEGSGRILEVLSAGPDKQPGTGDDFVATSVTRKYFEPIGYLIDAAVRQFFAKSGTCILDAATLRQEVLPRGVDLDALLDPWGAPYGFYFYVTRGSDSAPTACVCEVEAGVARRRPGEGPNIVWRSSLDFFTDTRQKIANAIAVRADESGRVPRNDQELGPLLAGVGLDLQGLRDPWGSVCYVTYPQTGEPVPDSTYASQPPGREPTSTTRLRDWVKVWSPGPDHKAGNADDVLLAAVWRAVGDQKPEPPAALPVSADTGALQGLVRDASGGVLAGVTVEVMSQAGAERYSAVTSADGRYAIGNITPAVYRVEARLTGFRTAAFQPVPIAAGTVTSVNLTLQLASVAEEVQVKEPPATGTAAPRTRIATPRLRDYFPETLYWAPSVITDESGTAKVKFPLADSITTWKMKVMASTRAGEVGTAELDIPAFQPFFVDHDPPQALTVGDEVDLPVLLRNYLPRSQQVDVEMNRADWFTLRGARQQKMVVAAGESRTAVFPMTAVATVTDGAQQVSATSGTAGDRVEKTVTVHPNGEERATAAARLLRGEVSARVQIPADIVQNSLRSTVKICPTLLAHLVDGVEATTRRRQGCAEDVLSSMYPGLLLLRRDAEAKAPAGIMRQAEKQAREGFRRLSDHHTRMGGYSHWPFRYPDVAATAYAIRVLTLPDVWRFDRDGDIDALDMAADWLVWQQQPNGTWHGFSGDDETLTAYVAYALARMTRLSYRDELKRSAAEAVRRGLRALPPEPNAYALALQALAAAEMGNSDEAARAVSKLRALARRDGGDASWTLDTATPFGAWGRPARIETTAVAVQALATVDRRSPASADLIDAGLAFLLKEKDPFGTWYSAHATSDVLDALVAAIGEDREQRADTAVVVVNGEVGPSIEIPPGRAAGGPLVADITRWMKPGANTVEIRHGGATLHATVQVVSAYFTPWNRRADVREEALADESTAIRLAVGFDAASVGIGDRIRCNVRAERTGHGYGMMVAEVGLPPGADVDRQSLDAARTTSLVDAYEVQPDRVVFYLTPPFRRPFQTAFSFDFRLRFAMKARTAPSVLYDHANPDARVTLAPVDFVVLPVPRHAN